MAIATLSIDIVAKLANIERDMGKAASVAERNAKRMEDSYSRAGSVIKSAFAGLASAFSVGAIGAMVQSSIDAADALSKLSQRTGETVENLARLQYAGSLADVSNQGLADGLKKLSRNMADAVGGSGEAADAFKAIGVSVTDAFGNLRSSGAVLDDIADKFASYEDSAAKAALAQALFGRSGADLIPLLNSGSEGLKSMGDEAERLGIVFSTETAQGAEQFNDQMTRVRAALGAVAIQTTSQLLPLLNELTGALVDTAKESNNTADSFSPLLEAFRAVVVLGGNVKYTLETIGIALAGTAAQIDAFFSGGIQQFLGTRDIVKDVLADNRREFDAWERRVLTASRTTAAVFDDYSNEGRGRGIDGGGKVAAPNFKIPKASRASAGRAAKAIDDGQRLVEQLRDQVRATQELTNVEKLELAIADGKYKTATAGNLELARGYAETLDAIQRNKDAAAAEAEAWRERLNVLAEGARVFDATRTPMEALDIELLRLTSLLDQGAINMETFGRAASQAGQGFLDITEKAKETEDVLNEFAKSAATNIQSSFADFLFDPFEDGLEGMAKSFGNTIKRMIAEAVSADLTKRIFGDLSQGGLGTGWLGSLGKLFANADGGVYNSPSLSQYSGQVVSQPTFFAFARGAGVMGEAGPEAILPLERNASGQLGVRASGGGLTINFTLNGVTNEADGRRAGGQISRQILGALAGAQRFA